MQKSTPSVQPPRLSLRFNENDVEQCLRAAHDSHDFWSERNGTVALRCSLTLASGKTLAEFTLDAATLAPTLGARLDAASKQEMRKERSFYYLNGLLRALQTLRIRYRSLRVIEIDTDREFLRQHANVARIAKWKKHGFKGSDGQQIQMRALWNQLYDWFTSPVVGFDCKFLFD